MKSSENKSINKYSNGKYFFHQYLQRIPYMQKKIEEKNCFETNEEGIERKRFSIWMLFENQPENEMNDLKVSNCSKKMFTFT